MVIVKRYPNRKLYDTEAKKYITLDGIGDLIRQGIEVEVTDHTTGEDLTALTLTQIILNQERKQGGLLSNTFLTGLIRIGGDRLSAIQRSLFPSINFWYHTDEEIKLRIQALVSQGGLTEREGKDFEEKLIEQGTRMHEECAARGIPTPLETQLEEFLRQLQIPTHSDLVHLYHQLEELSSKLEEIVDERSKQD